MAALVLLVRHYADGATWARSAHTAIVTLIGGLVLFVLTHAVLVRRLRHL